MKILITGGAGFIGSNIADRYLKEGHEVVVIDNLISGFKKNLSPKIKFYEVGIESPEIASILEKEKPDVVNHHAAQIDVRRSVSDPVYDAHINILSTLNLLEASKKSGVKKIIFASSGGAISGEQEYFPADEEHPTEPLSPYGIGKLTIEKYLKFYHSVYGLPFVAHRYANIYGPRQNALGEAGVISIFCTQLLTKKPLTIYGDGKQTRDYVFVQDVVDCNVEALKPEVQGIFNVGTSVETDVNTLAQKLIEISGIPSPKPTHAASRAGEQRRSVLTRGTLQKHVPTLLSEGLKATFDYFRDAVNQS